MQVCAQHSDNLRHMGMLTNVFLFSLPFVITAYYVVCVVFFPQYYIWSTYEDLYGEWAQTYAFLCSFIFSVLILLKYRKQQYRIFFLLLAMASFYTFMEEVSWGQRIFTIDTPEFFQKHNYQNELNIHNLFTGPVSVWTKDFFEYLISLGLLGYGVLFPIAARFNYRPAIWLTKKGVLAPSLALSPAFMIAAMLEPEPFSFNEAEIAELLVALTVAYIAFSHWLQLQTSEPGIPNRQKSAAFFSSHLFILLLIGLSSVLTTNLLLKSPEQKKKIESRLSNGAERFAKRYKKYNHIQGVIGSLELYDQLKPNNTVILRKLASSYQDMGNLEKGKSYTHKAIAEGLRRYENAPDNVSTSVSLSKSYRQLKEYGRADFYARNALVFAQNNFDVEPESAHRAYWLAKASEQVGDHRYALRFFRRAFKLQPNHSRYKKAYYEKRRKMVEYDG